MQVIATLRGIVFMKHFYSMSKLETFHFVAGAIHLWNDFPVPRYQLAKIGINAIASIDQGNNYCI